MTEPPHILPIDDAAHHHAVQQLMPWYVNDTLEPAEAQRVHFHLQRCALCRIDYGVQQTLRTELRTDPIGTGSETAANRGFAALRGRLQPIPLRSRVAVQIVAAAHATRLHRGAMRVALVAQFAVILLLSALLFVRAPAGGDGASALRGTYVTRSAALPGQTQDQVLASFRDDAQEASVRALLLTLDARIIDGPTVTGAYVIAVRYGQGAHALQALRAQSGTVRRAEALSMAPHS